MDAGIPSSTSPGASLAVPASGDQERRDATPDIVADLADTLDRLIVGIGEGPVSALETRDRRTGVAAAHRDQQRRSAGELLGEALWSGAREIDPDLAHRADDLRVDVIGGRRAGG